MNIFINMPKTESEQELLSNRLIKVGIDESEALIFARIMGLASKDKKILNAIDKYNKEVVGRMESQIRSCIKKAYVDNLLSDKKISLGNCAGMISFQISQYTANPNVRAAFNISVRSAKKYSTKLRVSLCRFKTNHRIQSLMKKYPGLNINAFAYLHVVGKLNLKNDDFNIINIFLENLVKNKENK